MSGSLPVPAGFNPQGVAAFADLYTRAHRAAPWVTGVVTGIALAVCLVSAWSSR
jgi:multisubunit Na+/H+ antiporter MnhG subunit